MVEEQGLIAGERFLHFLIVKTMGIWHGEVLEMQSTVKGDSWREVRDELLLRVKSEMQITPSIDTLWREPRARVASKWGAITDSAVMKRVDCIDGVTVLCKVGSCKDNKLGLLFSDL